MKSFLSCSLIFIFGFLKFAKVNTIFVIWLDTYIVNFHPVNFLTYFHVKFITLEDNVTFTLLCKYHYF